jgi:hypothetical protein
MTKSQKSEVRSQKSEVGSLKSEVGSLKSEVRTKDRKSKFHYFATLLPRCLSFYLCWFERAL